MSKSTGKKVHVILDIWLAYADSLLKEYNGSWSRYAHYTPKYYVYHKIGGKKVEIMNYAKFRKIIEHYFDKAKYAIIHRAEALDMYGGLGKICVRRVERDYRKKAKINWHLTRQQPLVWNEEKQKDEYKPRIYFTGDDWVRIGWHRNKRLQNETGYEFKPAAPSHDKKTGFSLELAKAIEADSLLKYQYLFIPKMP